MKVFSSLVPMTVCPALVDEAQAGIKIAQLQDQRKSTESATETSVV